MKTEATVRSKLDHENVVKMIDVFEDQRYYCMCTEPISGPNLLDMLFDKGQFKEDQAREIVHSLVNAISHCHKQVIMHRDINLESMQLTSPEADIDMESIKLVKFDLARPYHDYLYMEDQNEDVMFTLGYVAPEVLKKGQYGMEADYWSIGVVAFMALSGKMPFFSDDLHLFL